MKTYTTRVKIIKACATYMQRLVIHGPVRSWN